ncbi:arsenite efflux transporter metallochaperone ArsD [Photobacterium profundum]|uniref:Hypothetical repressor protein n=1 Tax=Photobacterium profundum (strain SS9) TaxID=298386 RepID=Q6LRX4_PHOPR|nr:arsenite efflux transporter metallochaperone ArsD [Photobacterium profundum]CAG19952.1 hypothetical repressor protein [Photobacterium profundum SS9]
MKRIQVFDPSMCCSSGVCGTDVDALLVAFSADVDWLKAKNVDIERFNLAQQPMAFVEHAAVAGFLETAGAEGLPLTLVNDQVVLTGRYATREELTRWAGLNVTASETSVDVSTSTSCCSSSCKC